MTTCPELFPQNLPELSTLFIPNFWGIHFKADSMKKGILATLLFLPLFSLGQLLTNGSNLNITKTWSQEPNGHTFPVSILVPPGTVPQSGFPVCILLHGNGGNGMGMIAQFSNVLDCHVLVAPTGYQNSWNICAENSDAPDVEMVTELVDMLQGYVNVDSSRIRVLGSSNGGGLANRMLIENSDPGIDIVCAIVTQVNEAQYHLGSFYKPAAATDPSASYCGYSAPASPLPSRKYLSICNTNDQVIPYLGGPSVVGLDFLPAEEAVYIVARNQGYSGSQLTSGTTFGNPVVTEFAYLAGDVTLLSGDAAHATNSTQRDYIKTFLGDCNLPMAVAEPDRNGLELYPNPTKSSISLERTSSLPAPFQIRNSFGQVVLAGTCRAKNMRLDLSDLPSNVYFLQLDGQTVLLVKTD